MNESMPVTTSTKGCDDIEKACEHQLLAISSLYGVEGVS